MKGLIMVYQSIAAKKRIQRRNKRVKAMNAFMGAPMIVIMGLLGIGLGLYIVQLIKG